MTPGDNKEHHQPEKDKGDDRGRKRSAPDEQDSKGSGEDNIGGGRAGSDSDRDDAKYPFKSSPNKRKREKKRRDLFNEGIDQLAELIFQIDPTCKEPEGAGNGKSKGSQGQGGPFANPPTLITNRGELMDSAVSVMERLIQQNKDQKTTIEKLEEALKAEMEKNQSLAVAQRVMRSDSDESPHDLGPYTVSPAEEEHQNRHRSELPLASKAAQASASLSGANGDSVARLQPDRMFGLTEQDSNRNLAFPSTLRKVGGPVGFITAFPEASAITMQLRYGPAGSAGSGKDQADGDETSGVC